jgi:hypothetical protein
MEAMVALPLAQLGQVGIGLLFAISLLVAMLGVAGFVWALIALWQDNHPHRIAARRGSVTLRKQLWPIGGRRRGSDSELAGAGRS